MRDSSRATRAQAPPAPESFGHTLDRGRHLLDQLESAARDPVDGETAVALAVVRSTDRPLETIDQSRHVGARR